jgi:hypothetical protein
MQMSLPETGKVFATGCNQSYLNSDLRTSSFGAAQPEFRYLP